MAVARYIALPLISRYLSMDPTNRDISGLHCIAWIQVLAWHWTDNKSLAEQMMTESLIYFCICVTRLQWVNPSCFELFDIMEKSDAYHIQSGAVITRSSITWYCIHQCCDWGRIQIRVWTHKRHPISRPKTYRQVYNIRRTSVDN